MSETPYLPEKATSFEFVSRSYSSASPEISFTYQVHFSDAEPLLFTEKLVLEDEAWATKLPEVFREALLDDLHLILGVSYYKLFCPRSFVISQSFSKERATFWNTVYKKGLGEFLYRNNLHPDIIAIFESTEGAARTPTTLTMNEARVLVGIGGGKDSIVSLELLREYERTGFVVATAKERRITDEVATIAGVDVVSISRVLDEKLIKGIPGSYNGHVPISAVYAFLGVLQAALSGHGHFVVSNEHSSNFGNLLHEGNEVNHKWSGSSEFEMLFQSYVRRELTADVRYFSLTRPFYELRVVELFAQLGEKYFNAFTSCNRNFAHDHDGHTNWCGECPKCAFTYLMLAAFLEPAVVRGIFKKDLFEDAALVPLYRDLLGCGAMKPFDCVGTFDESRVALKIANERGFGGTRMVRELLPLLKGVEQNNDVFKVQQAKTVPSRFRMLGMRSALILGYGKEGQATELYLKNRFPHIDVGIADQKDGPAYLKQQHEYDITIKTPVIPGREVVRHYTTATNFFFKEVPRKQIIGVTGSKGKSTTSTLLFEMLKRGGKKVRLVGNIGIPALEELLKQPPDGDELFVFELSSYQLEDLDVSPHIAIVTSLFPEHLDQHGSLEAYYAAKRNITAFQNAEDAFVYAPNDERLHVWAEETAAETIAGLELPFTFNNLSLRGEHMHSNVRLAYTVARICGVGDADIEETLRTFEGLPHRLKYVGSYQDIAFYDDSISTTPESTIAALRALGHVHTIILGGVDRGLDFSELEYVLREHGVQTIILFPDTGLRMLQAETGFTVLHTASMDEAVQFAYEHTPAGETCLLSPASPSYNLFTNFEERGDAFITAAKKYGNG